MQYLVIARRLAWRISFEKHCLIGEYSKLYDFDVDSENIYLYDYNAIQLLKYGLQGNFIEANKLPFRSGALKILENGKYLSAIEQEENNATFVYNTVSNRYYFYDWTPEEVYNIVFANNKYLVGWMDIGLYEMLKNKPALDSSAMAILEEGGHVLVFYHLKQNEY